MRADWVAIRNEYVTTQCSYHDLSIKYKVPESTMRKHGMTEHWTEQRNSVKAETEQKIRERISQELTENGVEKLRKLIEASDKVGEILVDVVEGMSQSGKEVNIYALKEVTLTIKALTAAMRDLNGIPTRQEQESLEIARERLALDRKKADGSTDNEVTVSFGKDADKWAG